MSMKTTLFFAALEEPLEWSLVASRTMPDLTRADPPRQRQGLLIGGKSNPARQNIHESRNKSGRHMYPDDNSVTIHDGHCKNRIRQRKAHATRSKLENEVSM